ncbi:alpha/beta fold hydrolase [Actinomadura madurae]|uniref:alpha/beta fold hydrolase n=1 Tax=Actinomadura madurae TaxID=1993 RepID=UPI0020D251BF|nr:alpha/beta hydrolase [Actinomadura madurae]MCP9953066.1 alpha/beta hydrolase [Actinomadura madurae]MCP9969833.1 alpha/beta hydrolase [Actinomadura madurae]MCP9982284.1 alpha/beta hydrolase [Actinomadura madurae]MCQ0006187.1 alpha/beta hydrolase [Actinomadura madurae]
MDSKSRRRIGIAGVVAGVGAAGVGAAVGLRHLAVGRVRLRPDPDAGEPFGELRGRATTVLADDGVPLHVEVDGPEDADLTVVFCHGYALNQDSWHYQRRDLQGSLRMVFWDQRSHGRSGRSDLANATIEQTGDDLRAVLEATVRPGARVVLAGHSMGGMAIMAFADRHRELFEERVVGVALVNTSCGDLAEMTLGLPMVLAKAVRPLAPRTLRGLGRRAELVEKARGLGADLAFVVTRKMAFADKYVSPSVVDFLEQMIRATPIDVIAEFYPALMAHDKAGCLDVLGGVPALVLVGGRDRLTPAAHGRRIAEAMPEAELVEVEQAGHVLPLEYPGVVTGGLRRLIDRVRPEYAEERSA